MQGGDPTGVGDDGHSIYTDPPNDEESTFFKDEIHPLLKPERRGLLLMANLNIVDTNTSQFCITFAATPELYKKNTVFGRIEGETIYNLLKIEKCETDDNDRPTGDGVIIEKITVVKNPFTDIFPRDLKQVRPDLYEELIKQKTEGKDEKTGKDKSGKTGNKKRAKVNRKKGKLKAKNLLSFGDEEDEMPVVTKKKKKGKKIAIPGDDEGMIRKKLKKKKILSPFDLLKNDKTLSKEAGLSQAELAKMEAAKNERLEKERIKNQIKNAADGNLLGKRDPNSAEDEKSNLNKTKMREDMKQLLNNQVDGMKVKKNAKTGRFEIAFDSNSSRSSSTDSSSSDSGSSVDTEEQIVPTTIKFKENKTGTLNHEGRQRKREEKKLLSRVELKRYKYMKK
jgi:peptidyl-prolyl cis-trans isomerase SDCCAG10